MLPRYERGWDWEDDVAAALAGTLVGIALLVTIIVIAAVVTLIIALLKELVRIFAAGVRDPERGRYLWWTLGGFLVLLLVAGLLALTPLAGAGLVLAGWAFLAFVIVVEALDVAGAPSTDALSAEPAIDDVLVPWDLHAPRDAA